ncbi:Alpha/Beta hydrolase protein [Gilbertella persicaria]|uniref:Alpha/Beta hydrolase protein n=1 Tax=Gilbertella persicaria TaxID=101096 RepID=UPI00221FD17A|nr:Alpha/Beta hydrolase protein [Gilbertella persicaria]KAI8077362.1 Alpha/Beta hydrolase protein [Gilbertella persicaria]
MSKSSHTLGIKLNYQVLGLNNNNTSPLIFLIHGAGGDLHHYASVTPHLIESGYRVLLMDVRFHGLSQPTKAIEQVNFSFEDVIHDMNWILRQVKQEFYAGHTIQLFLGGLSMGGMISLLYAQSKACGNYTWDNIILRGVIPMAAGIPCMELERQGWDVYRERKATPEFLEWSKSAIIQSSLTLEGQKETERAIKSISDAAMYECMVAIAMQLPNPSNPPISYKPTVFVPMLLILPEGDEYTRKEIELLHQINLKHGISSHLIVVPNAGHMIVLDKSKDVSQYIVEFCSRVMTTK